MVSTVEAESLDRKRRLRCSEKFWKAAAELKTQFGTEDNTKTEDKSWLRKS